MDRVFEDWIFPIIIFTAILWFAKKGGPAPAVMGATATTCFFAYFVFQYRKIKNK